MTGTETTARAHLAIICRGCGEGGSVASVALRQARELSRRLDVVLLSDSFPSTPESFRCIAVTGSSFGWLRRFAHVPHEIAFARAASRALFSLHASGEIDFVITHAHSVAALAARPLQKRKSVPFALVTHGDIFERPPGTYDPLLTRFYRLVTPPAYRSADLILALSPAMAEAALARGASAKRIAVIPNGIDPKEIGLDKVRAHEIAASGPLRLLFVGRLAVEKGILELVDACKLLRERGVSFRLEVVGNGPLEVAARARVAELGLEEHVVLLGPRPRTALGSLYRSADLVCVPSISEPLGIVVLEALAAGTPVLGSEVGGIPFMIEHGRNGVLVPAGSPDAIADAIAQLAPDRDQLRRMAAATIPSVLPRFFWESIGEQIGERIVAVLRRGSPQFRESESAKADPR